MRILRIYHGGRNPGHRARERRLTELGHEVTLVIPSNWPQPGGDSRSAPEDFRVVELAVRRSGDINRYAFRNPEAIGRLVSEFRPDVVDIHEEPFSVAARQALSTIPETVPVVMYTAQNIDKRYPPPFAQYERRALRRVRGLYPCSSQAAAVARSKGADGIISVLPLGYDEAVFFPGSQSLDDDPLTLMLVGRFVPEKGLVDAVHALASANAVRPARLVLVGEGAESEAALVAAAALGVADRVTVKPWVPAEALADIYRQSHVALVPSRTTPTWVEQFGRVITEAHACGVPVVGYASGSIPEVGGNTAVLVREGDVQGLGASTACLLQDVEDWEQRRQAGIQAARNSTWAVVVSGLLELYRRVVSGEVPKTDALGRAPAERRRIAAAEFRPPARVMGQKRPFALPLLRSQTWLGGAIGAGIDALAEANHHLRRRF